MVTVAVIVKELSELSLRLSEVVLSVMVVPAWEVDPELVVEATL